MAKKRKFSFRAANAQNVKAQAQRNNKFRYLDLPSGIELFKVKEPGEVALDFLPYYPTNEHHMDRDEATGAGGAGGNPWWKCPYEIYRNIGADGLVVVSPRFKGEPCPITEYVAERRRAGADKEELSAFRTSLRNLYAVVPRNVVGYKEKVHVFDISQFFFQAKLNEEMSYQDAHGEFPDPDEGYTVVVRFVEKRFGAAKGLAASRIDFIKRTKPIPDSLLDTVPNLDEVLMIKPYAELDRLLNELPPAGNEDNVIEYEREPVNRDIDESKWDKQEEEAKKESEPEEQEEEAPADRRQALDPEPEEEEARPPRSRTRPAPDPEPEEEKEPPVRQRTRRKQQEVDISTNVAMQDEDDTDEYVRPARRRRK